VIACSKAATAPSTSPIADLTLPRLFQLSKSPGKGRHDHCIGGLGLGQPALLLMEIGQQSTQSGVVAASAAERFRLVILSRRGQGRREIGPRRSIVGCERQ
jgi:hypothetical protein